MAKLTFSGGIHPPENKITKDIPIKDARLPEKVVIPLIQHSGAPAKPLVKKGDYVLRNQKIGEGEDGAGKISATVHSSISGTVKDICMWDHPVINEPVLSVVIESDGKDRQEIPKKTYRDYYRYSPNEIRNVIYSSGIVGLGGAAFPTHVKLSPAKEIDTVLLNGCECEPYLTCDDRLMQEHPEEIIAGLKIIMYILGVYNAYVVIENNKPQAIDAIKRVVFKEPNISVKVVQTKYPEGAEKQLIKAVLGRVVPAGKLPFEVGVVVHNVATAFAIYQAVVDGIPLVKRVVTVTGDSVEFPGNYNVRIGTLLSDLLAECGWKQSSNQKIIHGGPLMGIAEYSLDVPIIKGTSGIVVIDSSVVFGGKSRNNTYDSGEYQPCVRCGRCIDACPMELLPNFISIYVENNQFDKSKEYFPMDCIECGCCAYVCPAKRPLVQHIKLAKITKEKVIKQF